MKLEKKKGAAHTALCAALLMLLATSGYVGAEKREETAAVSVPIVFETVEAGTFVNADTKEETDRLESEQERALSLLEDVIRDPRASEQTAQNALKEKTRIAAEIEKEAKLETALGQVGIKAVKVMIGEQMLNVFAAASALDDKTRVQIVDMACAVAGVSPECVKIIPIKNE